jgi:hypothetical protein
MWLEEHVLHGRLIAWPIAIKGSPLRGLAPFDVRHARVFFGRSRAISRAVNRLKAAAARDAPFLLLVGASGTGKFSLARAGLIPRLTTPGVVADVDIWHTVVMRLGAGVLSLRSLSAFWTKGSRSIRRRGADARAGCALGCHHPDPSARDECPPSDQNFPGLDAPGLTLAAELNG